MPPIYEEEEEEKPKKESALIVMGIICNLMCRLGFVHYGVYFVYVIKVLPMKRMMQRHLL